jgi:hypothetical protein
MSNMRKTDPEDLNANNRQSVVLLNDFQRQYSLVKVNRALLLLLAVLMTLVVMMGFLLLPSYDISDKLPEQQKISTSVQALKTPGLSQEIDILKGQLVGLVSGSIESKLRILEQSIRSGSLATSLGAIEDIKNDVKVLRSYSQPRTVESISPEVTQLNQKLIDELSQLKRLIYLTLGSCGVMIAAIAGFWLRNRFRLEYEGRDRKYLGKSE